MIVKFVTLAVLLTAVHGNVVAPRQGNLNTYNLFTLSNKITPVPITSSDFEVDGAIPELLAGVQTIVVVHGHGGDAYSTLNPAIKNGFLTLDEDINIIVVDWSSYSKLSYSTAVAAVPSVGTALGTFLALLVEKNRISLDSIHLIGFNLGAHAVGFAGRYLNGEVARITGLDPSGSQWGSSTPRLSATDAKYVEVIHTDGAGLLGSNGIGKALGHIDFFVNGGKNQPGCLTHSCSHNRAWELYAATLSRSEPLYGYPCSSNLQLTLNTCKGVPAALGGTGLYKLAAPGIYRVNTGKRFPY